MSLVWSKTDSGVLVGEHGSSDERAIGRLLKDHDRDLRLVPRIAFGRRAWSVYRYAGPDRPAEFVCFWGNQRDGPFPLSARIVDMVKQLDRNSPVNTPNEDELNRLERERLERQRQADYEALAEDWQFRHGRPVLPRGQGLRRARDKRRSRGENT